MNVGIIIQARLGSTRLPQKVLRTIHGKTLLQWCVERCKSTGLPICVATPDERIADLANTMGVQDFLGDEDNVCLRMIDAAHDCKFDAFVRVNCDCPFIFPSEIVQVVEHLEHDHDYVSFLVNHANSVLSHVGAPEGIHLCLLERIAEYVGQCNEHVTWGAYQPQPKPNDPTYLPLEPRCAMTIDTQGDLDKWNSLSTEELLAITDPHLSLRK